MRKAVVVDDDPIIRMDLADILAGAGFAVVGQGDDGFDAVELCKTHKPDLVTLDIKMPVFDGLDAAKNIVKDNLAGCVVIISAYNDSEFIAKATSAGVAGYVVKPVDERTLLPAVEIALAQSNRYKQAVGESARMQGRLEERSLIDRAKAILIRKDGISENEAHATLQKISMSKSLSLAEVARRLVQSSDSRSEIDKAKAVLMERCNLTEKEAYHKIQKYCQTRSCDMAEAARHFLESR